MKPTQIATGTSVAASSDLLVPVAPLNTGAIVLHQDQLPQVEQAVASLDFAAIPPADILKFGFTAEQALQHTLDGFLARLDKNTASKVFALFGRLQKGVDDANLGEVLAKIQSGENPGFLTNLFKSMFGKSRDEVVREIMDSISEMVSGRTRNLVDEMKRLEGELTTEIQRLFTELQALDTLKGAYSQHFAAFTVDAAIARAFLEKARAYVQQEEASLNPSDVVAQGKLQDLKNKLTLLESRALALEGTYTRLPADQLVIQQIENAGIATLQETATTVSSRFASIKMTLLTINAAFAVKGVQQINDSQAKLDAQLLALRGQAIKDVAVAAAKAPGDNRLAQAQQIAAVIATTREIAALVKTAEAETGAKFETARSLFAQSREELAALSAA